MDPVILKGSNVRRDHSAAARRIAATAAGTEPTVRCIQIDGRVAAIEVRCACGDTTTVELVLEAAPGNASPGGAA